MGKRAASQQRFACPPSAHHGPSACPTAPPAGADVSTLEAAAAAGGKAAATKAVARSDSVLIVKNLPFSSSLEELETMFGAAGGWQKWSGCG